MYYVVYHSSFPKIYDPSQKNVYYAPLIMKGKTCSVTPVPLGSYTVGTANFRVGTCLLGPIRGTAPNHSNSRPHLYTFLA